MQKPACSTSVCGADTCVTQVCFVSSSVAVGHPVQVIDLREKRLDQEEVLADFQKVVDDLRKAHDRHSQRLRQVEKDLAGASADIARFQQEKQQRLNNIDVIVSLTLSQIYSLVPGKLDFVSVSSPAKPAQCGVAWLSCPGSLRAGEADDDADQKGMSDSRTSLAGPGSSVRVASSISNCVLLGKATLAKLRAKSGSLIQVCAGRSCLGLPSESIPAVRRYVYSLPALCDDNLCLAWTSAGVPVCASVRWG